MGSWPHKSQAVWIARQSCSLIINNLTKRPKLLSEIKGHHGEPQSRTVKGNQSKRKQRKSTLKDKILGKVRGPNRQRKEHRTENPTHREERPRRSEGRDMVPDFPDLKYSFHETQFYFISLRLPYILPYISITLPPLIIFHVIISGVFFFFLQPRTSIRIAHFQLKDQHF